MNILKKIIYAVGFALIVAAPISVVTTPQVTYAAVIATPPACDRPILGIPTWYRGLTDADCNVVSPDKVGGLSNFIWQIVLNVIEIGLFIAGYGALLFILYGGFLFLTGGGNQAQIEKARKTLLNAVIGLAISMASIAAVNFIFRIING